MDIVYFFSPLSFFFSFIIIQIQFMVGPVSFQRVFVHFVRVYTARKYSKSFHAVVARFRLLNTLMHATE